MSAQAPLDPEDQIKIDSWFYVMNLLEHYRALTFDPAYQIRLNALGRVDGFDQDEAADEGEE
jgi:hypothetical protein